MHVSLARSLVAASLLAAMWLVPARTADAAVITLAFTGTYGYSPNTVFGEGSDTPFSYSITYDTELGGTPTFIAAGTHDAVHDITYAHDYYGYSAAGIIATNLTFGTQTFTVGDIDPLGTGLSHDVVADFWLDADLNVAMPTLTWIRFRNGVGTLTLGESVVTSRQYVMTPDSRVEESTSFPSRRMVADLTLTATRVDTPPTPVPEPTSIALLGAGLVGAAMRRLRRGKRSPMV